MTVNYEARGGRAAKAYAKQERFEDALYDTGVLTIAAEARERATAEAAPCFRCGELVHPTNYLRHLQHYHVDALVLEIDLEFRSLIPSQTKEEVTGLQQSLIDEGCRDALVTWNGILIDGHHRYAICTFFGIGFGCHEREFESREDAIVWMVQNQLSRRNITPFARSELALKMKTAVEAKAKANSRSNLKQNTNADSQNSDTRINRTDETIANAAGVSRDTIRKVEEIVGDAPEQIKEKARSGKLSTNRAYEMTKAVKGASQSIISFVAENDIDEPKKVRILIRLEKSAQLPDSNDTFTEILTTGGFHHGKDMTLWCDFVNDDIEVIEAAIAWLSEHHRRIAAEARRANRETAPDDMPEKEQRYALVTGDAAEILPLLGSGWIDAMITDPPYPEEYLHVYETLAINAARLLKPGASLIVMCGQSYLPQVLALMTPHIRYHWTLRYEAQGEHTRLFHRNVHCQWKPILWFVNGDYSGPWISDTVKSDMNDKRFHHWGQSESGMADIITKFSCAGDTILDPFVGGGATALAALALNRKVIGVDINADCITTTQDRIFEYLDRT